MPFLLLLPVSGHLSHGFTVTPTKRTYSALPSALPWISEDRQFCLPSKINLIAMCKLQALVYDINNYAIGQKIDLKNVNYWVIQAGLLTPLTFARHRLSPLAAFTSGAYFLHKKGGDSEFANFTLPTLKAFLEARSHNVSGNNLLLVL